jgi:hypothetical protein
MAERLVFTKRDGLTLVQHAGQGAHWPEPNLADVLLL